MPVHQNPPASLSQILFWQPLYRFLSTRQFVICPFELPMETSLDKVLTFTKKGGRIREVCGSLEQALDLALKIRRALLESSDESIGEWNYLGNSQEKEAYLRYLDQFFWRHQNQESLVARPDYPELIAETFKISKCVSDLDLDLLAAIEKMSDKSREFLTRLEGSLKGWELNPYLINDSLGNFHWSLLVGGEYLLEGSICKEPQGFVQRISFDCLA